jgi:glycosyltransferase involved in cell wall biosynthesis
MKISYAITVCNELKELTSLINFLLVRIDSEDEVVIQYDSESVTKEVVDYLNIISDIQKQIKIISFPLNKDFASFKNNLKEHCEGKYIFQIDADEEPSEILLERLKQILTINEVDIIFVPRVNTVEGLTQSHIQKWGWKVDDKGWVNWPDYQTRIYKNTEEVQWHGKVHERITGYTTFTNFPSDENYSLYHHKEIERQEKQNDFYDKI